MSTKIRKTKTIVLAALLVASLPVMSVAYTGFGADNPGTVAANEYSGDEVEEYYEDFSDGTMDGWNGSSGEISTTSYSGSFSLRESAGSSYPVEWDDGPTINTYEDFEVTGIVRPDRGDSDNHVRVGMVESHLDNRAVISFGPGGEDRTYLDGGNSETGQSSEYISSNFDGQWANFRLQYDDGVMKAKVWEVAASEPSEWQITHTAPEIEGKFAIAAGSTEDGRDIYLDEVQMGDHGVGSDPITGQVVDQHGDPVENATTEAWGVSETAFDESDVADVEDQIYELEQQLEDPLPADFEDFREEFEASTEGLFDAGEFAADMDDGTYPLVHQSNDWGEGRTGYLRSEVDDPRLHVDPDETVEISLWDASEQGGILSSITDNPVDSSHPGDLTDGTVVLRQIDPTGDPLETRELETEANRELSNSIPFTSDTPIHTVQTELPEGVYQVHPEGHPERVYTFTVGDPEDLAGAIANDFEETVMQLEDRQATIKELIDDETIVRERTTADENGEFEIDISDDVHTVSVQAYKGDDAILDVIEDIRDEDYDPENPPTLEDISIDDFREYQSEFDYNGTFYLPAETATYEPGEQNVTVRTVRTPDLPFADMDRYDSLHQWIQAEFLDQNISEFDDDWTTNLDELEDEIKEEILDDLEEFAEGHDELEELLAELEDTNDLTTQIEEIQAAIEDFENIRDEGGDGEISNGLLEYSHLFATSIDEAMVVIEYEDGDTETVPDEYISIQSAGVFDGDEVIVDGYEIDDDRAVADVSIQAQGADGIGMGSGSIQNPAFAGTVAELDAVTFNTLQPGPDERVYVGLEPSDPAEYQHLVDAQALDANGDELETEIDTDRDRASFTTNGQGMHTVRLTFESASGDQFDVTERVRAGEQSGPDYPTIRAGTSPVGAHATVGSGLESARLTQNSDGVFEVDAIIGAGENAPGELHVMPSAVLEGSSQEFEISIYEGDTEERIDSYVPVRIHYDEDEYDESAIAWRNGNAITREGDTRFGEVEERDSGKILVTSYTDENGQIGVEIDHDPWYNDRLSHWADYTLPSLSDLPLVPGLLDALVIGPDVPLTAAEPIVTQTTTTASELLTTATMTPMTPTTAAPTGVAA